MSIDPELIDGCLKNSRKHQERLFKVCFSPLMSVCLRYHHNHEDARAVANLSFLKILDKLQTYRPEVPFEAWVKRIALNSIIDDYRKNKKINESTSLVEFQDFNDHHDLTDFNLADQDFDAQELLRMIAQLPPATKAVFNLFAIDGLPHKEIADQLGISEGTSKWQLAQARKLLQDKIKSLRKQLKTVLLWLINNTR